MDVVKLQSRKSCNQLGGCTIYVIYAAPPGGGVGGSGAGLVLV